MRRARRWWDGWLYRKTSTWSLPGLGSLAVGYELRQYPLIEIRVPLVVVRPIVRRH